jgi:hypothetical protein
MKKLLLFCFVLLSFSISFSQFGNEWIDYSRVHYKIKVWRDGIYRIPYSTLAANVPNIGSVNTSNLVLFRNGQQVPIYISTLSANLGPGDFIEFYGQKNTGDIDTDLYGNANDQPHPHYSLFTDTSIYFLTTRGGSNFARFTDIPNDLNNLPARENYFIHEVRQTPNGKLFNGKYYTAGTDEVYKSLFETGEGYANTTFFGTINSSGSAPQVTLQQYTLATPAVYTSGPNAVLKTVYANNSTENHTVIAKLNNNQIFTQSVFGFKLNKTSDNIPVSQLLASNAIAFSTSDNAVSKRQNTVSLVEIDYPRSFDFDNQSTFYFKISADAVNRKYLEISNFNSSSTVPVLYDITNGYRIVSTQAAGTLPLRFALPASSFNRELFLRSDAAGSYFTVTEMKSVSFTNYSQRQGNYVIISHASLRELYNGKDQIEEYRKYRDANDNPGVGRFVAVGTDIDQLYDQFAFGVSKSPLAIRNFVRMANANWTIKPQYVFLIGKGREYPDMRNPNGTSQTAALNQCLIPTFGFPGSDNLLTSTRTSDRQLAAVGRLAAHNPAEVESYLEKMRDYEIAQSTSAVEYTQNEPIADRLWQKQVLHFSGGTSTFEQSLFRTYLSNYSRFVTDSLWGGNVTSYSRTSSAPIDQSLAQVIRNKITEGATLITFFGHSYAGGFDFSIDEPENYTNRGKYPVIISNGCFAGLIHDPLPNYSERFVLPANRGAIAFIATTSLSLPSGLNSYTGFFYKNLNLSNYNRNLGDCTRGAIDSILSSNSSDFDRMVLYEMTTHGDPGALVNQYPKPDFAIEPSSVYFTPTSITPGLDSFTVNIVVTNLGRVVNDSIAVTLKRTIFDASNAAVSYNYRKSVRATFYRDTVSFKMPAQISTLGYGQNLFEPYVEADRRIDEMAENNNGLTSAVSLFIQSDDVIPIYPYEFAIVPTQGVTLKASTVNPFARARNYKFQIDTSELFLNPLQTGDVFQSGGVLHFTPTITYRDSVVYYWRVAIDSSAPVWRYSSFIYLNGEFPGWNQSHFYQWKKDSYLNMSLDNDRVFRFPANINTIHVQTGNGGAGNPYFENLGWDLNNYNMYRWRMGGCGFLNGITLAVIDSVTGEPLTSYNYLPAGAVQDNWGDKFGNYHCDDKVPYQYGFDFATSGTHPPISSAIPGSVNISNQSWSTVIKRFVDSIPNSSYVLIYSTNIVNYAAWDANLVNTMQSLGFPATQFQTQQISGPFVFFTQKNSQTFTPFFAYKQGYATPLDTSFTFVGTWNKGQMLSTPIGPAQSWGSMHWRDFSVENPSHDRDTVDVIGISSTGVETNLLSTTIADNIISNINASNYPYLRLRLRTTDDTTRTPTQLKYWRILYHKAPEAAINPAAHFVFRDSISLGESLNIEIALESITEEPMDSMLTKYVIRDAQNSNYTTYIRHSPLPGLDTLILKYNSRINGNSFNGLNKIIIEANPDDDQIEQYHFNNIAEINFNTVGDKINPLLDVTFDGQRIMNGDIVSAKPEILITLKDENRFLALNDTDLMNVYIKYPGAANPERVSYTNNFMTFYPADSTNLGNNNKAQIVMKPEFTIDGTYELMVKDRDRSGNNSATTDSRYEGNVFYDYKTSFEVVNKPMITNVLNYPNPFTTSTHFVFTITGSEVPDFMKIQIMTIKGTVVKEIMKEELGPLRIGRNITEYTWDGRDQYGDILANGVYFYRVITRLNDKQMDAMSQGYDKYFKKGFGKMVIVR